MPRVGVLAIQGDFLEHRQVLERIGVEAPEIRLPHQLDEVEGLIIPGGESTTIVQLIDIYGFRDASIVADVSRGLGDAMAGLDVRTMPKEEQLATRGW